MAGDTGMAGKVALLLWAQTLGLAGAQSTQLLVEPPWTPAVLWDRVTLTCQGSGTAGATTWYKDGLRWWQEGHDSFSVTENGTYQCERPGSGISSPVVVSNEPLVLQVPARALLEGDTVTLRCRGRQDSPVTKVRFYKDEWDLGESLGGTELSLSPLELHNSGRYRCGGLVASGMSLSAPVTVTVHELKPVLVLEGPPELTEGSPLNLSCLSTPSPLRPPAPLLYRFYRDGQSVGGPQGSPQLLVPAVGVSHSGNYSCEVRSEGGAVRKSSARLGVTVRMPVANATITPGPPALQVHPGDPVTLRCSVQVGSAPVTFTWLHDGHEVGPGSPPGAWGHRCGTFGHLPVRGHQPAGTGRAPRVPGTQPRAGPGGDTTGNHWTPLEHSGCECWQDPLVPAPAPGCHRGLSLVAPPGFQEAPGQESPGGGGSIGPPHRGH
ncbi:LOW QUALITY PROTEIN: Fc receptor-like A [Oenanthe melanoleuca]|uniref:LOW QUALITY PROTEIN: Fc receptor-like A n=1 Tax=Oenanthe melanoleuca TaxID=2939378 RepID=UPI0024C1A2B2|nr:LOW QUALITY PROTEIN: Fc receptor-like A [Oenanthe melanoleuca]